MAGSKSKHRCVIFNTDCEGPTVANDHAFEVAQQWAGPDGGRLYKQLSSFDDFTAYVLRRPFYNTGDTLRLVLPFLKACGQLTDARLDEWTRRPPRVQWIAGAVPAIRQLLKTQRIEVFEISASYYPFASLVAELLRIPKDRVYSTYFSLDSFDMGPMEATRLRQLAAEIVMLDDIPPVNLECDFRGVDDFPIEKRPPLRRMIEIVWGEMAEELPCSARMLKEIRSMGGHEKFNAICDSLWRMQKEKGKVEKEDIIYVGDSITDVEAFRAVSEMGGVSVAFNGNHYAVDAAEFCAWGDTSLINAMIAGICRDHGKDGLREFIERRTPKLIPPELSTLYKRLLGTDWDIAERSRANRDKLVSKSEHYREKTRAAASALS
jgi:energy-converting hydrogenase A subunit R